MHRWFDLAFGGNQIVESSDTIENDQMHRRHLLWTITAVIGTAYFVNQRPQQESSMKASEEKFEVTKPDTEWREDLTPEQYRVLRQHGTERAGTSPLDKTYTKGTYQCAGCGKPLFTAETKFDSGTGWPSFYQPIEGAIATTSDRTLFMARTEVHCSRCGGHLGHVFNDGPAPTGQRYCMNGVALEFTPESA